MRGMDVVSSPGMAAEARAVHYVTMLGERISALSIKEPWASLIVRDSKRCENRSWPTSFRGLVVICASKTFDGNAAARREFEARHGRTLGHALGFARLLGCDTNMQTEWDREGQFHFRLGAPRAFAEPIACSGRLGLFVPNREVLKAVQWHLQQSRRGSF